MLRRFFSYYRPYRLLFTIDFMCAVIAGLMELGFPLAVNYVVDELLPSGDFESIIVACTGLLAVYVITAFLHFIVTYWGHMLGINIETDMRSRMFDHLQKLGFRFFDNNKTGHLMSRITNDLMDIGEMAHHGPEDLFIAVMTLIGAFLLMLGINWKLAVLTFIIVPIVIWLALYFNTKMTKAFRKLYGNIANFNSRVENTIGGIRVVQAFANEGFEKKRFEQDNREFRLTKLFSYKIMAQNITISYMLTRSINLFVLICGTWFILQGELTYGQFAAFLLLTNVFFRPIDKINAIIESYPKGIAGFQRYIELLDTEPDVKDSKDAREAPDFEGNIHYENVSFSYDDGSKVLNKINLSIKAGETVAFVGPSGAGKTTICSLLPRFYEASEGRITIDGADTSKITLASLRKQIGIVQQDVFLFAGTVRENIAYGKLDASDEEIWTAARLAQLAPTIEAMPEGMETVIGERGVKLSGGQKQRIAIARMFLKNPKILILDEATSALDTETEAAIQQSLAELSQGRTTLVIAHRLATIKNADRIIVVTPNGIEEEGSHEELVARSGVYSRLHTAQFSELS
ncbi:ABC transporter ATP-binding protein [Paenibacillus urinalis]|uniref:ABC transporter ATP-binding protein n=1 Tax=Paenibacillus urinalis TaxID=521520 RepID=A0ABY7XG18_9BACL|nr:MULTISPECIES: ABC transporter ATP-binding protein [Paenibacillus]WDH95567.1 ABC transporter ATP-binding protein [Paenibacillus urinalis]WDI03764.1 ABC transporter ATP-binding protein [Paenibacillus urinalis]